MSELVFLGEFEVTLDVKGRFLLPGSLKKQLEEKGQGNRFVINRGFDKYLNFFPYSSWESMIKRMSKLNDFDPKVREFKLLFLGGATEVILDTAGRILLPSSLRNFAGINKDMILVSNVDKILIWDATKYKNKFEDFSPEQFSLLASEVMKDVSF